MQEASREEVIGTNVLKTNSLCVVGEKEEGQPTETNMEEKEQTLKSAQKIKEEDSHIVVIQRNVQEEHSNGMLT
jgi:NACalpha-BTF3-like transcription factor